MAVSTLRNIVISGDMVVGSIKRMEMSIWKAYPLTTQVSYSGKSVKVSTSKMIMRIIGTVDSNQVALIITATTRGAIIF